MLLLVGGVDNVLEESRRQDAPQHIEGLLVAMGHQRQQVVAARAASSRGRTPHKGSGRGTVSMFHRQEFWDNTSYEATRPSHTHRRHTQRAQQRCAQRGHLFGGIGRPELLLVNGGRFEGAYQLDQHGAAVARAVLERT